MNMVNKPAFLKPVPSLSYKINGDNGIAIADH